MNFLFRKLLEQLNSSTNGQQENYEKLKDELTQVNKHRKKFEEKIKPIICYS